MSRLRAGHASPKGSLSPETKVFVQLEGLSPNCPSRSNIPLLPLCSSRSVRWRLLLAAIRDCTATNLCWSCYRLQASSERANPSPCSALRFVSPACLKVRPGAPPYEMLMGPRRIVSYRRSQGMTLADARTRRPVTLAAHRANLAVPVTRQ